MRGGLRGGLRGPLRCGFRQEIAELGQEPEDQGRVLTAGHDRPVREEEADGAAPVGAGPQELGHIKRRLAEEPGSAALLELEQRPLDGSDGGRRDAPVRGADLGRVVGSVLEHRAQVLGVQEEEAAVVSDAVGDREHGFLRVVEIEEAREEERAHVCDRRAKRVALGAERVPEDHRVRSGAGADVGAGLGEARELPAGVRREDRHANLGELFGEHLQRGCLAGGGCSCDIAVPDR